MTTLKKAIGAIATVATLGTTTASADIVRANTQKPTCQVQKKNLEKTINTTTCKGLPKKTKEGIVFTGKESIENGIVCIREEVALVNALEDLYLCQNTEGRDGENGIKGAAHQMRGNMQNALLALTLMKPDECSKVVINGEVAMQVEKNCETTDIK